MMLYRIQFFRKRGEWFTSTTQFGLHWHSRGDQGFSNEVVRKSSTRAFLASVARHRKTLAKLDKQRVGT